MKKKCNFKIGIHTIINSIILLTCIILSYLLSSKSLYKKIKDYIPKLNDLLSFSIPIFLAILPIIIGISTLIYQLYYNRYTLKEFKSAIKSEFRWLILLSCLELSSIFIFWITKEESPLFFFFVLTFLVFLTIKFCIFLFRYNKYSIDGFVSKYTDNSISIINSKNVNLNDLTNLLKGINEYFTESIEKKENNYIRLIINAKRKILCSFIKNERSLLLDKKISKEDDEELLNIFVHSFSRDLRYLSDNEASKKTIGIYANAIIKTLQECVLCDNYELYSTIITDFTESFHFTNRNDFPLNYYIDIFEITYEKNLKNKTIDRKYNLFLEDILLKLLITIIHEAENSEIEQRIMLSNGRIVYLSLDNYETSLFETIFDKYISAIGKIIPFLTKKESEILVGILGSIYLEVEKEEKQNLYDILCNKVFEIIMVSFRNKKETCIEYLGTLFHDLIRNPLFTASTDNHETIIKIILTCIRIFPESSMLYLPDLKKQINDNKKNNSKITEISKCIEKIFNGLINIEKYEILHFYLEYLNDCILIFSSEEREAQDIFINLYKEILIGSIRTDSNIRFDICYSYFYDLIVKLDNERIISANLLETIFNLYDRVGGYLLDTNDYSIQSYFLQSFSELTKNLRVIKNKGQKQKITEILFHFSIEMLESKNEKSLRICSNTIGWYAVSLEDSGDFESYKVTVDAAIHMYELALSQEYETSTIAFLGTLFIILGAYATVQKSGISYADYVKEKVNKLKDSHHIKISRELRYFESKYWDKTLNNDAKNAISRFYEKLQLKP